MDETPILPFIEALARELSTEDHRWVAHDNPHENPYYAELESQLTGFRVACCHERWQRRIGFRAIGPMDPKGREAYIVDQGPARVTLGLDRDAKSAAADLRRRFIDGWLAAWPTIMAKANGELSSWDGCQTYLSELKSMAGGEVRLPGTYDRNHKLYTHFHDGSGLYNHPGFVATVWRPDTVSLEIRDIPAELGRRVVQLLANELGPRKT